MFHIIRALLVTLLASLVLAGCSAVRLGYGQLPSLSYWWVDSYVDLNDAQSVALRRDLSALQDWHRAQELPKLAALLARVQSQALQDTTPAQTCQIVDQLKERVQAVLTQAEPGMATLAVQLTPAQLQHLTHQLTKREQTWREEWVQPSADQQAARRLDRLVDRSEAFYGKLSDAQRALLTVAVQANPYNATLAEADLLRRHQELQQTLQSIVQGHDSVAQAQAKLHPMLLRQIDSPDTAYSAQAAQFTLANCRTFAQLHNSTTPAQRQKLVDKLRAYELDLRALSAPG